MFGFFVNKKKEEVSLAERIEEKALLTEAPVREGVANARASFAGLGTVTG